MTMRGAEEANPGKGKNLAEKEVDSRDLARQLETLRKDLAELGSTVRGLAQAGTARAQRNLRETRDEMALRGQELAEDARTAGQRAVEYGSEVFKDKYTEFELTVRRHPTTAVAVALGLGYLAGLISRHRS